MKLNIQKGIDPHTNEIVWLMLDDRYEVVEPIQRYLTYLSTGKSPNTVEAYAYGRVDFKQFDRFHMPYGIGTRGLLKVDRKEPNRKMTRLNISLKKYGNS